MSASKFVWYELMTSNPPEAEQFYKAVFGWDMQDSGMPGPGKYTIISSGGKMLGGLMAIPEAARNNNAPPSWVGYIGVDDVDQKAKDVQQAGGIIHHGPEDIPGVGRFAVVADPQGAVFMLFKGTGQPGERPAFMEPGHIGWHELHAADQAAVFPFYEKLFGWTKAEAHDMGPMGIYQLFAAGNGAVGGMTTKMANMPHPFWLYYVSVPSVTAGMEKTKANGGQVLHGPMEVPGGMHIAHCRDPQGVTYAMVGPLG